MVMSGYAVAADNPVSVRRKRGKGSVTKIGADSELKKGHLQGRCPVEETKNQLEF
jgi:hypothetical protein